MPGSSDALFVSNQQDGEFKILLLEISPIENEIETSGASDLTYESLAVVTLSGLFQFNYI